MSEANRKITGSIGEIAVRQWYEKSGYECIVQNWRCASGELDLILKKESAQELIFCEVRTRVIRKMKSTLSSEIENGVAWALESIHLRKQRQIRQLAKIFLNQSNGQVAIKDGIRFDCAAVILDANSNQVVHLEVLENAF